MKNSHIILFILSICLIIYICQQNIEEFCVKTSIRDCTSINKCRASTEDIKNAQKYAYKKLCESRGYKYQDYGEDGYGCYHTKTSCLRESSYPSTDTKKYLEWSPERKCILGMEMFRDYCKPPLFYDIETGRCKVTAESCDSWGAGMNTARTDCEKTDGRVVLETAFGTNLVGLVEHGFRCP